MKLAALVSGGKDSVYAMYKLLNNVKCIVTIKSINPDSFMYHTPNIDLVKLQAKSIGLPIIFKETKGEKEIELEDLKLALKEAIKKYKIDGIVCGALYSNYQKERLEKICKELNLKLYSPLWHMDPEQELREILKAGFKFRIIKVACDGLDNTWLKEITEKDIDELVKLSKKYRFNPAGEGGEYESFVTDGPIFKKKIFLN